jgi:hypothetical protein
MRDLIQGFPNHRRKSSLTPDRQGYILDLPIRKLGKSI